MRTIAHALRLTIVISLLQPAPEVWDLFDDTLLLTDGCGFSGTLVLICIITKHESVPQRLPEHMPRSIQTTAWLPLHCVLCDGVDP